MRYPRSLVDHASQFPYHPFSTIVLLAFNAQQHSSSLRLKAFIPPFQTISLKLDPLA